MRIGLRANSISQSCFKDCINRLLSEKYLKLVNDGEGDPALARGIAQEGLTVVQEGWTITQGWAWCRRAVLPGSSLPPAACTLQM